MQIADGAGAGAAWEELPPGGRASLQQALTALRTGGLAVGSALTGPDGAVVAAGRNRAYDPPGGDDALQSTALAHAELNALARVHTRRNLARDVLWSTQQPCAMCDAAAAFTGVGAIRWLSPDPSAGAAGSIGGVPTADVEDGVRRTGPRPDLGGQRWRVLASALFLASVAGAAPPDGGPDHPLVRSAGRDEPGLMTVVEALTTRAAALPPSAEQLVVDVWPVLEAAVARRVVG